MSNYVENKIIEEIHRRVFEAEQQKHWDEQWEIERDIALSTIMDNSSMSEEDIDKIIEQVHHEIMKEEQQKQKTSSMYFLVFLAILSVSSLISAFIYNNIYYWLFLSVSILGFGYFLKIHLLYYKKKAIIIDNFNNETFKWRQNNAFQQKRHFENDSYQFETGLKGRCYWDAFGINLPTNFDILCNVKHLSGGNDQSFGVILEDVQNDYIGFELNNICQSSIVVRHQGKWDVNRPWRKNENIKKDAINKLELQIRNKNFNFRINGIRVQWGKIKKLKQLKKIGIRVCNQQKVEFQLFSVVNADTNRTLFFDDFTQPSEKWEPKEQGAYEKYFKNGKYHIRTDRDDWCYWSHEEARMKKDFSVELKSTSLEGENCYRGIVLYYSSSMDKYFKFELKRDGSAQFYHKTDPGFTSKEIKTKAISDGKSSHTQKITIRNRRIKYYIDNQLVHKTYYPQGGLHRVGVVSCGKQTVRFEKLVIQEL